MAEQVNQRIENMINELEQMRRTDLFNDDEIREISRKRKELEYKLQRRMKRKEDYVYYITYELALLEDISIRRKQAKMIEKKKDIEYAIARRLNRVFKQFIVRFQNDVEVYFQYIKFCKCVGFDYAIGQIISQMLQIHGDKPKMWQMASKWESQQNNLETARTFLVKGIHRHPDSEALYLELFKIELKLAFKAETDEEREKQLKKIDVVWKNGLKDIKNTTFLFELYNLSVIYEIAESITNDIKNEIWSRRNEKEVWSFVASKELEGQHWPEIEEFVESKIELPVVVSNFMGIYEQALDQFSDQKLCTKYIHEMLGLNDNICSNSEKIQAVKYAWMYGHENGLLTNDMYEFGIQMLNLGNSHEYNIMEILDLACKQNPKCRCIWEEKLMLNKSDEKAMLSILQEATKVLSSDDALHVWNLMLDTIESKDMINKLYKKFQNCENKILLALKPKLLQKMFEQNNIKAARDLYEEFIRTPPTQIEVHRIMIDIEYSQDKPNAKGIRKCYECAVQHHGKDNVGLWMDYMQFETKNGNAQAAPAIYRRAIAMLNKELVDEFIKAQTMAKLKM